MAETIKLPQIEVVGKADGVPPTLPRFVEDLWTRVVEVHFGDNEDEASYTVVTNRGPGIGDTGSVHADVYAFVVEFSARTKTPEGGYTSFDLGTSGDGNFSVGVGTKKIADYHGEPPAVTYSVEVVGYKQKRQDPNNPNDPPPLGISFEKQADGSIKVLNGSEIYRSAASAPSVGAVKLEILITFNNKAIV